MTDSNKRPRLSRLRVQGYRHWLFPSYLTLSLLAFTGLALLARRKPYFAVDIEIERRVQSFHPPWFDRLMRSVCYTGYPPQASIFGALIVAALWRLGRYWEAAVEAVIIVGGSSLFVTLSTLVNRPRPDSSIVTVHSPIPWGGFPSGHAITLTSTLGYLGFLVYSSGLPLRRTVVVMIAGLIALIGPARIYSGEHWPSDVLAGYLIGTSWLGVGVRLYRWGKTGAGVPAQCVERLAARVSARR